ncbi:MAG: WYL domain-containing protein [Clostridia bacterium]|nr:WYL domain-containing protein [Clostridia bacterium]
MPKENCQKIKLLKLMEILRQETDEQHPLRASAICARLVEQGITCDRRTLSRDIALLNEQGFEVMWAMLGHEKGYYVEDRSFSVPELKILIDAVQAASFVTEKKTEELIGKIAALGGSHQAEILTGNQVSFNTRKHSNESIYYTVDRLEQALVRQKKVIFRYYDLDANGQKAYRRDGHHYVVEPVGLVFNEDNYYLMTYSSRHGNTANYRVDRMDSVEIIDEPICEQAVILRESVAGYTEQAFKMYGGQPEQITIRFANHLIGAVYDRFGENTRMIPLGETECAATVKVQLSPTFWGWLFQFGGALRILSPDSAIEQYREKVAQLAE